MATAYAGYGGEFSSDEDIEKMEQQSERLAQSNVFAQQVKPTKRQVDEVIETVRKLPIDQDIQLSDELISGLLDHFKTQRGPIVDSTRNLYKKIVLRLIREQQQQQQQQQQATDNNKESNGNINNDIINNNNNINPSKQQVEMAASSDEDEPMPPVDNRRKLDVRVVYNEPMEVDQETPSGGAIRSKKQIDISTTDDDSESSSSETQESTDDDDEDNEDEEDSEELDITPVKPKSINLPTKTVGPIKPLSEPAAQVSKSSEVKKSKAAIGLSSTPVDSKKKPYTRSQRIVVTRSNSAKKLDVSSSKDGQSAEVFAKQATKNSLAGKFRVRYIVSALFIAAIAFFLYYFRSDLTKSTNRIVSRAINF